MPNVPKVSKCLNGHFYDSERYSTCPYCNPVDQSSQSANSEPSEIHTVPLESVQTVPLTQQNNKQPIPYGHTTDINNTVASDQQKTIAKFVTDKNGRSPVVGWLVCIEGKHYGQDFKLKAGNNFIGRDKTMDVVLSSDMSVSRNKHAIVTFDPASCSFIVRAGESHELSYLNGKILLEPKKLKIYDKLSIGTSILMFVPLISDSFNWNEK